MSRRHAVVRYRISVGLLLFGIIALLAIVPFAFVAWGSPWGPIVPYMALGGVTSILLATLIGLFNYLEQRRIHHADVPAEND
jgi:hypothetical protein